MASVGSVYVGSDPRGSVSHSTTAIFPSISQNASFVSSSGNILSTAIPVRFWKISPSDWFSARSISATRFITIVYAGILVNCPHMIFFPVRIYRKLYIPFTFPIGPRQITPFVCSLIVLVMFMYSCTCAYVPKVSLHIFFQSIFWPFMIDRELYVVDIPLFGGKALRIITTCFSRSILIHHVKLGNVRLALCVYIRSLITFICSSNSCAWSRALAVWSLVISTLSSNNWKSGSTNIVLTKIPCDL